MGVNGTEVSSILMHMLLTLLRSTPSWVYYPVSLTALEMAGFDLACAKVRLLPLYPDSSSLTCPGTETFKLFFASPSNSIESFKLIGLHSVLRFFILFLILEAN